MDRNMALFQLIRASLWDESVPPDNITSETVEELRTQALLSLPAPILADLVMDDDLRENWKKHIIQHLYYQTKYRHIERTLPVNVPYVILKGTSVTKYYPHPEFRTLGDIDIFTRHEDYETACNSLLNNGFEESRAGHLSEIRRHRAFIYQGVTIEVHSYFSLLNDPEKAKWLDDLIIQNINDSHVLPDLVNGLIIIEHINQHLERGIGLRQIIDWMMFVNECLPDERWQDFCELVRHIGLEKLAVITTRMCEMYFDLQQHRWCKDTDEKICKDLMNYVINSGNFGRKRKGDIDVGANILVYIHNPFAFIHLLQERGLVNWKAAKRHTVLRPFAWLYQFGRYLKKGIGRNNSINMVKNEVSIARQRMRLFKALNVMQRSKGLSMYKEGKYVKTFNSP